ncbi:MAG: MOSC domain-containing protein [Thermomicrobiales bacterium]|nr:MOSC domain-containing protein [Thermomicrobiales bacterium]
MEQARVLTVNIGQRELNPHGKAESTGIHKRPIDEPVYVSAPGVSGSGLAGDFIGDPKHHGGDDQAVYIFAREDLDRWEQIKGRAFPNGSFGENLTTVGVDVNEALIGERWRIGDDLVLEVTSPRIPCTTFRGVISEPKWIKEFTADARPGTYFKVIASGMIKAGDPIEVIHRPPHDVSISIVFRATTTDRSLNTKLQEAAEYLPPDLVQYAATAVVDKDPE